MTVAVVATASLVKPSESSLSDVAVMCGLVAYPLVLVAATFLYVHWRLCDTEISGWLTIGMAAAGLTGLTVSGAITARPSLLVHATTWLVLVELAVALSLLCVVVLAERRVPVGDPMAVGFGIGVGLSAMFGVATMTSPPAVARDVLTMVALLPLVANLGLAWYLTHRTTLPGWCAVRIAAGAAMLNGGDVALVLFPGSPAGTAVRLLGTIGGSVLLVCTAQALLRAGILEATGALRAASGRVATVEERLDTEQARLHEIGSTFAGIASASRLISAPPDTLQGARRDALERMVEQETARLERLLGQRRGTTVEFDLDQVLEQLVTSHQAQGRPVVWEPSGQRVVGVPDDFAEIIDVLLDNAAKHGQGLVRVAITSRDDIVEVAVSDEGTGVSDELRDGDLFDWGRRGSRSQGQGIGLHIARGLAESHGGYLTLRPESRRTTFIVGLLMGEHNNDAVVGNVTG